MAARLAFRAFTAADGLKSLGGACMIQDRDGHLLICSDQGVFFYDGRRFVDLGPAQGLRDGGIVFDLSLTDDGRIAIRYADQLLISKLPISIDRPPTSLRFQPVAVPKGSTLYSRYKFQTAPWRGSLVILVGGHAMQLVVPSDAGRPHLAAVGYDPVEAEALDGPRSVFSVRGKLWEAFDDRVCSADPGFVRCYGTNQGLVGGPWEDIIAGSGGTVLARSLGSLATIDPLSGQVKEESLPDQGGTYSNYAGTLGLFRTPSGDLMTPSVGGLIVRKATGWVELTMRDGIPQGTVSSAMSGRNGELWLQVFGSGLFMSLGYGHWQSVGKDDGLSTGMPWQTARSADGSLWVTTDTGLDQVKDVDGRLQVVRVVPVASFSLDVGPDGDIWSSSGDKGITVADPLTSAATPIAIPPTNMITTGLNHRVWLGTEKGLFHVDVRRGEPLIAFRDGPSSRSIAAILLDGSRGTWLLSDGRLWHRHADGTVRRVSGEWPGRGFDPLVMASAAHGHVWIGGYGGLYNVALSNDRVASLTAIPKSDTLSNSIVALMIDHRGWVWVGNEMGVSVYNGSRWVSVNADRGLVGSDVSQGGLREDPDGSVWIATSQGVSHLLDPAWLFADHPLRIVVAEATLGATALPARQLSFSTAPLALQFGAMDYGSQRSIVFHYRLSGVDDGWADSTTGAVRYPFVPPGRHLLTVVGYDTLTHVTSAPATLTIRMDYPWWRQWWAYVLYLATILGLLYGALLWRERETLLQRRELERLVQERTHDLEQRTREMRAAQAELKRQATLDSLTGMLNRGEVQRRLAESLASRDETRELVIAMIDLDHFKHINDVHGHLAGDDVLQATGIRIAAMLRRDEYAGRYGGEEFIVVLDDTDGQGARRILVLHQAIRQAPFHVDEAPIPVTCSIGAAWAAPGDTWKSLIRRADAALYDAKNSGRDRIVESREDQSLDAPSATKA